jgi:hypothetical protein
MRVRGLHVRAVALVCLVAAALFTTAAIADAGGTAPPSSPAALQRTIVAALKVNSLPSDLSPSLAAVASLGTGHFAGAGWLLGKACGPDGNDAFDPCPAFFGLKSAKKTIVVFGDSFVSNWLPALNIDAKLLGIRLAAFEFSGCATPFVPQQPFPGFPEADVQLCNEWHHNLPAAVIKLKPLAVIAANGAPDGWPVADGPWEAGLKLAFQEMTPGEPKIRRILLGAGPHFSTPAPACLAAYPTAIQNCTLSYKTSASNYYGAALLRDKAAVRAANAVLIPTVQWMCAQDRCPVVVGDHLVYLDADHISISYSEYLSAVLLKVLAKAI